MDPLSVAASVAGLLTAAKEVSSAIDRIVTARRKGFKEIIAIKSTVDTLRSVLLQLQLLLLSRASINRERASLILVDEVVVTLTACVMTFSDLDGCMKGLEADQKLDLMDSIRWASKDTELKSYLRDLEAHKTSLTLMMSILTCQSTHNAEKDAGELKVLMVRVLESNESLAHRMSLMENSMAMSSSIHQDQDLASIISQETIRGPPAATYDLASSQESGQYTPVQHAFEEDLEQSWVYQRSKARDVRFSVTSSAQLSLSWSMLSGLSLSNISNIAVQSLPIFEKDLQNSQVYNFGRTVFKTTEGESTIPTEDRATRTTKSINMELWEHSDFCVNYGNHSDSGPDCTDACRIYKAALPTALSNSNQSARSIPFLRRKPVAQQKLQQPEGEQLFQPSPKPAKDLDASSIWYWPAPPSAIDFPSLPSSHVLQKNGRIPLSARKHVQKTSISTPKLVSSSYKHGIVENTAPLQPSKLAVELGLREESVGQTDDRPELTQRDSISMLEVSHESTSHGHFEDVNEEIHNLLEEMKLPAARLSPNDSPRSSISSPSSDNSNDTITYDTAQEDEEESSAKPYNILYLAASVFEFNIPETKIEAGYPYLMYQVGEIFDILAEKGELWLARNQEDEGETVGWIWSKHFIKID